MWFPLFWEEQNNMQGFRKTVAQTKLDAAQARYMVWKCNMFLDFMWQANEEERAWALCIATFQRFDSRTKKRWEFDGPDLLMLVLDENDNDVGLYFSRNGALLQLYLDTYFESLRWINRYPWIHRTDDSVSLLTTDALTKIFSYLALPQDLRSVTQVSHHWRKAALAPLLYTPRIERLLRKAHMKQPPFFDPFFQPHQYYFALSFISCKTPNELGMKILRWSCAGHLEWAVFCRALHGGWGVALLETDWSIIHNPTNGFWFLNNGMSREKLYINDRIYADNVEIISAHHNITFTHPAWRPPFYQNKP